METATYLYPWDVNGDPAAADVVAGLGLHHVTLAAVTQLLRRFVQRQPHGLPYFAAHVRADLPDASALIAQ